MKQRRFLSTGYLQYLLAVLCLLILGIYGFVRLAGMPYAGFRYSRAGEVIQVFVEPSKLQVGDKIVMINEDTWEAFISDPWRTLPPPPLSLEVTRESAPEPITVTWHFPAEKSEEFIARINSEWWLAGVFWLAGLATALFIRPRDERQILLMCLNFLTAVWLIAGGVALSHFWGAIFTFKSAIWLATPVYLHFHWIFPYPLRPLSGKLLAAGYGLAFLLVGAEWLQMLPNRLYLVGLLIGLGGSLLFLFIRLFYREQRRWVAKLFLVVGLAMVPVGIIEALSLWLPLDIPFHFLRGGALLAFPAVPGAYFYTIYQAQLGPVKTKSRRLIPIYIGTVIVGTLALVIAALFINTIIRSDAFWGIGLALLILALVIVLASVVPFFILPNLEAAYTLPTEELSFRANHIAAKFFFGLILVFALGLVALWLESEPDFLGKTSVTIVGTAVFVGLAIGFVYPPFSQFVEHQLLGIKLPPSQLSSDYAQRITSSLNRDELIHLLTADVLPSLFIRHSTLLYFQDVPHATQLDVMERLYQQRVSDVMIPPLTLLSSQWESTSEPVLNPLPVYPWIRLGLPLYLDGDLSGIWLLGRRDPDDLYNQYDIALLQTLAAQTAVALAHILQAENLQALHQANINRHEKERIHLAHILHDDILNQVTMLNTFHDVADHDHFQQTQQELSRSLRQVISGLRPASLMYGLSGALEELVDNLRERNGSVTITLTMESEPVRYGEDIEAHLFRIIQQAGENALRHAQAQTIHIIAQLMSQHVELCVNDDGCGFEQHPDLARLVEQKHYGLANMYERASMIGARLQIESAPEVGTKIVIAWPARKR